jgi:glycosyltransferase involved in cell wall biosynthesis
MIGTPYETNIALLPKPDPAPLITIITVVLNARDLIGPTLRSVAEQSYENIQHVIIDGGSSDGTLEVIMANEASVDLWISEHDHGVYDAMNKGIGFARGEWITFLNAGDVYTSQRMLAELAPLMVDGADILYGDHEIRFADYTLIYRARPAEELWKNMVFCHQTVFARTSLVKELMFSTILRISADYDMMMRAYLAGYRFVNSRMVIASVPAGGMSDSAVYSGVLERFMVLHRLSLLSYKIITYYLFVLLLRTVRVLALAVLPSAVVLKVRKLTKGNL